MITKIHHRIPLFFFMTAVINQKFRVNFLCQHGPDKASALKENVDIRSVCLMAKNYAVLNSVLFYPRTFMATINLKSFKHPLLCVVPAIFLLVSLMPVLMPYVFVILLQIIVSLSAAYISYLLFIEKPKYYLIWVIAFILVVLMFNPIMQLNVIMGIIPLALVAAVLFLANWWFVFKTG